MLTVSIERSSGLLHGKFDKQSLAIARSMPGRTRWRQGKMVFELSSGNVLHISENIPDVIWEKELDEVLKKVHTVKEEAEKVRQNKNTECTGTVFEFKTKPFDHQLKAFELSKDLDDFGYFMEMGTGKSKVLLDVAAYKYAQGEIDTLFILAPNGVHRQWVNEQVPDHLPDWCSPKCFIWAGKTGKKDLLELEEIYSYSEGLRVFSMNVEAMSRGKGIDWAFKVLRLLPKTMLALDESSRIKTPGSKRTKSITKLGKTAAYKRILSGSPVTKGAEDLFSQFKFLDEHILGFTSFYTFRNYFCDMGGWEGKQVIGYKNMDELQERIEGHSFRVTKEDCLDLPAKIYTTREVDLTPEQRKYYEILKEECYLMLKDNTVLDATLAIVRLMRLQQIICGYLPILDEDGNTTGYQKLDNNRVATTKEIVDEAQGQVILWARFKNDINSLKEALPSDDYVSYTGETSIKDRKEAVERFRAGEIKTFIANPAAAGIGLNLQVANTVVYYSNDFNAETRWQSEDRAHRIGQTDHVNYIDLIAPKTIDRKIVNALRNKKNIANLIIDNIEELLED